MNHLVSARLNDVDTSAAQYLVGSTLWNQYLFDVHFPVSDYLFLSELLGLYILTRYSVKTKGFQIGAVSFKKNQQSKLGAHRVFFKTPFSLKVPRGRGPEKLVVCILHKKLKYTNNTV